VTQTHGSEAAARGRAPPKRRRVGVGARVNAKRWVGVGARVNAKRWVGVGARVNAKRRRVGVCCVDDGVITLINAKRTLITLIR
jgi:hypothetical protein